MTAITTIKVFGLKEYDEVEIPVQDLPSLRSGFATMAELAGRSHKPIATACLHVLRSALLTNNGDTDNFTDVQNRTSIARTVFIFASESKDANFDAVRGNFIIVEATFQSFGCTIYRADQEDKFRHDLRIAKNHHEAFLGILEPQGRRATPRAGTSRRTGNRSIH